MNESRTAAMDGSIAAVVARLGMRHPRIEVLAGGVANHSFRLREGGRDVVLRISGEATRGLGASGASEHAMHALAADAGLAPVVVFADPAHGLLVAEYVAGVMPGESDLRQPAMLRRVGAWIARLHALEPPPGLAVVDFGERATRYLARLQARDPSSANSEFARELERRRVALPNPERLMSCHHDLHHRNFVDAGDALLVIDWEYAGPGDPAADLAACIGYHDLDSLGVDALLEGYGRDSAELRTRVAALGWIFDCLWFGWNACAADSGLELDRNLQSRLARRLVR